MQSVYNLLILSQHVAAQLQTRHFECEKFLFKVVLLSSASIARANRFGFGRLCWTTCTNSTSSKASHKSEQKNANRKSNREQQIIINYPTLSKSCKNSSWILDWAEHGQDLHESHPKTGFSLRFCYLPPYKTARAFCSLLDRVCVCVWSFKSSCVIGVRAWYHIAKAISARKRQLNLRKFSSEFLWQVEAENKDSGQNYKQSLNKIKQD